MLTYSMTLSPLQPGIKMPRRSNGAIVPTTIAETALCENMREVGSVQLEAVGLPTAIASLTAEAVAADKRGDKQYLFTCNIDKELKLEGYIRDDNRFVSLNTPIATLPTKVKQFASAGEFLILLLNDGRLWYMLWNSDLEIYTPLGLLPEMPVVDASPTMSVGYTSIIAEMDFGDTIADLRSGIPEKIVKETDKRVINAWREVAETVASARLWSQPVSVRFAVRLWDGRLLHISEPQIVSPQEGFYRPQRILLPLVGNENGFSGTMPAAVSLDGFKISVSVKNDWKIGDWKDVIRGVEVWVSPGLDIINENNPVEVAAYSTSSVNYLSAFIPTKGDAELAKELVGTDHYLHSMLTLDMLEESSVELSYEGEKSLMEVVATDDLLTLKANCIMGHGDFIYLGGISRSLPKPIIHPSHDDGDSIPCIISVKLTTSAGEQRVTNRQILTSSSLSPLLSYPDSNATEMEIKMQCADGVHYSQFPLRRHPTANYALYHSSDLSPIGIPLDAAQEFIDEEPTSHHRLYPSTIISTHRGNPLVEKSRTENCGGEILALSAQSAGGGAYTRQFIYLFTNKGIIALTHKPDGEHTNCRLIASDTVSSQQCVCTSADCVYAASVAGDILKLTDAHRKTLFSRLKGVSALAWNRPTQELWLIPNPTVSDTWHRSIVVQMLQNNRVWLSSEMPRNLINNSGEPLYVDVGNIINPETSAYSGVLKSLSLEQQPVNNQLWISAPIENVKRGIIIGRIGIFGEDVEADVEVESISEGLRLPARGYSHERCTLDRVHLTGNFTTPVEMHFVVGRDNTSSPLFPARRRLLHSKLRFRISGLLPTLNTITLL